MEAVFGPCKFYTIIEDVSLTLEDTVKKELRRFGACQMRKMISSIKAEVRFVRQTLKSLVGSPVGLE